MIWDKANIMFPDGKVPISGKYITIEELENSNCDTAGLVLNKPVKTMVENIEQIFYHIDGEIERYYLYNIYPGPYVDNKPLFNAYGQKIYNNLKGITGFYEQN